MLEAAINALHTREFYAAFPEHPSPAIYGETADASGLAAYQQLLGKPYDSLLQTGSYAKGKETSPYSGKSLGITYPASDITHYLNSAAEAATSWGQASVQTRAGILIESLIRMRKHFFDIAYATMHTTGQGFMMAFQASGPHAADRALEAIATGYDEITRFPASVEWIKPLGKSTIQLKKTWQVVPKGISVVIGCSTFPTWNTVPGVYASLITGNPVIVKPHPGSILPIAIVVSILQEVFEEFGFDPNLCQLAVDEPEAPITKELVMHPKVKLIDFTGNSDFGSWLESLQGKTVFTEKTGVNSIIIDSVTDAEKVAANIAFSISLYSGQMCTAPQNIFIPKGGIETAAGNLSAAAFGEMIANQIKLLAENPKAGPFVLGAIQNPVTLERLDGLKKSGLTILAESKAYSHPQFPEARTSTPMLLLVDSTQREWINKEWFGPAAFLITTSDTNESLELAADLARMHGAISCGAYTINEVTKQKITAVMTSVGSPVAFNLTGGIYVNQHAAFSDFHVTGANPAGNASFTNPEFLTRRFDRIGIRELV